MPPDDEAPARFLHPAGGALILGLDWLLFSGSALTLGLSTPALAALGFAVGAVGTGLVQRRYGADSPLKSTLKGLLGGIAIGLPLPIAGTAVGGLILTLSGLDQLSGRERTDELPPSEQTPSEEK